MAWSNSKVFGAFLEDLLNGTTAHDLNTDGFKAALFNNSSTPDNTVSSANSTYGAGQWVSGNEATSTGEWDAGGKALASLSLSRSGAVVSWGAANPASSPGATMSDIYGTLVYNTTRSNRGVCFNYFGGVSAVSNGTFTVVWDSGLIATFTAT